jgi:starch phosphorylase
MTESPAGDPLAPFVGRTHTAYFSMEIAIREEMHTYAGGLGILAGDTARSAADLELPLVFVTLASRAGYFRQCLDADGNQGEDPDWWDLDACCTPLDAMIAVRIAERPVWISPWLALHTCPHGRSIPILLLDTDLDQNAPEDRSLTDFLYGGDDAYRLKQEIVLGIGGYRLLTALGFEIGTYHMNEGHAALLTLELMNRFRLPPPEWREGEPRHDLGAVRERCVFTTHTPVEAGHDRFDYRLVTQLLPQAAQLDEIRRLAGRDRLNMTRLALNLSGYVNGVARRHAETTEQMFPGYRIRAVTNGVHPGTWVHPAFARLFDRTMSQWQHEPEILVRALQLDDREVRDCHREAKQDLVAHVRDSVGVDLDPDLPVIGFARRMTGYKRPLLLFSDLDRLVAIAEHRPFQIVLAGKAHPRDWDGKEAIRRLHEIARKLAGKIRCVYLPNYDMGQAKRLVAGCDIWLNTPLPPMEASGTSGMKAALNGVLNLSVPDGWWLEACIEGVTGWSIGDDGDGDGGHAAELYEKLQGTVLPLYHGSPDRWSWMMKQAIGNIGYYFNSQRMMRRYASEAYLR